MVKVTIYCAYYIVVALLVISSPVKAFTLCRA